jgi:hypothetical protein
MCTLGSNGCWAYGTPAICTGAHQSCTGAAGASTCACATDPYCTIGPTGGPNASCVDNMNLAACSIDGQGCPYETGTVACTNGACSSGSCCVNACKAGQKMCVPGTDLQETCILGSDGCYSYGNPVVNGPMCG